MAKEKDLLLDYLIEYSADSIERGMNSFERMRSAISIVDIKGKRYYLKVGTSRGPGHFYNVSIAVAVGEVSANCDCPVQQTFGACEHIALSAIYILVRAHGIEFDYIETLLENGDIINTYSKNNAGTEMKLVSNDLSPRARVATESLPVVATPVLSEWKFFTAQPQQVFQHISMYYYGTAPSQIVKNTNISGVSEEPVVVQCDCKVSKKTTYHPQIKYDRLETFYYRCDCNDHSVKMCYHVKAAFEVIAQQRDRRFFMGYKNWDVEKNKLLKPYGIELRDAEAREIEFEIDNWGQISMKAPAWLWKTDFADSLKGLKTILTTKGNEHQRPMLESDTIIDFEIGYLLNLTSQHFKTGFELEPVKVYEKNGKATVKKLTLHQHANLPLLKGLKDEIYELFLQINEDGIKKSLADQGHRAIFNYSSPWQMLDNHLIYLVKQHYFSVLKKFWPYLCEQDHVFVLREGNFSSSNIMPAHLSRSVLHFGFSVTENGKYITIALNKSIDGVMIPRDQGKLHLGFMFELNDQFYLLENVVDFDIISQFGHGFVKIPISGKKQVVQSIIPLLQKKYPVDIAESLVTRIVEPEPEPQILLKEMDGKFLVLQPQFKYQGITVNYEENPENLVMNLPEDDSCIVVVRNKEKEKLFYESTRLLHPKFSKQVQHHFFFLPFEETMKKNWFIDAIAGLVADKIPVIGIQDLRKHKYNTNKPVWTMKTGSGIDWFDLSIQVSFGEQQVSLHDIRKALFGGQNIVVLGDGTFGVMPEEWLKQYGMLLKMGEEQKDGKLRVSKLHYTLIDELHSQIDDEDILREINEKKQRLRHIGEVKMLMPSNAIQATLRPYQLTGFQWLHTLDEMGWGGCLADDMGLGKTLQAIAFLQYLKEKYETGTHLVICPTSLIYNWENEISKFAPSLKYHIYYGLEREFSEAHFNEYDLVISSYGVIRNDLQDLMQFDWHYIILDESQAIKNPDAQTNKALQLLKSRNRLILSGTPIQNNTFDLFAQFHFINPGLLGTREFFKSEFANPIDKLNDSEKSAQLRRLIYPFMLRRTKEQVAPDLPDKTETVLWCEMGREQRRVYEDYKNYYRETLMKKIEEVGMAKAGMYVLEGLLRLRQICDSPVLVKDATVTTRKSIKIEELLREIEENAGGHKLLVFSQFTEMLHLIEESLQQEKVQYVYLDGSTPADKRREAVQTFQENASIRVFLISLKAGGVGLNLTSADYVYIVDPWWNPAVEQQAIDRTHRIGQQNKIFAYKMICKDTVEEKIVQLQQRKKQLADDLVTEDAGFIKKLTKEDIAFLFS